MIPLRMTACIVFEIIRLEGFAHSRVVGLIMTLGHSPCLSQYFRSGRGCVHVDLNRTPVVSKGGLFLDAKIVLSWKRVLST